MSRGVVSMSKQIPISFNRHKQNIYEYLIKMDDRSKYIIDLVEKDLMEKEELQTPVTIDRNEIEKICIEVFQRLNNNSTQVCATTDDALKTIIELNDNDDDEF